MSELCPIELLDDDDDDDGFCDMIQRGHVVQSFLEIMGSDDKTFAKQRLKQVGYNLQQAITDSLTEPVDTLTGAKDVKHAPTHAFEKKVIVTTPIQLSPEWHQAYNRSQSMGPFVDPDFPPTQSSLDGRKHSSKDPSIVTCLCGLPATARTVQSDGPNYGKFYLACGQPRRFQGNQGKPPCKFFQWDKDGITGAGYATRWSDLSWHHFGPPDSSLYLKQIRPDQVRQGAVGNCWFLSALAVVAEKEYLVQQLLPHTTLNDTGCYQVNLCLDGRWVPVIIDSSLPVAYRERNPVKKSQTFRGGVPIEGSYVACPAFAATPDGQLWPALVEKAYAKAHGSYAQLSGGFIAEALSDMTGAPTETIVFSNSWDAEELWARLLSFSEAGFLMGVATSRGGDGLVGGHAYSILDVVEFHDSLVGEQQKVTDFFTQDAKRHKPDQVEPVGLACEGRTTIRLVRIRNPWGKREWKGEWSVNSEKWTNALRKRIGDQSFAKGDGTFFMAFDDMLERFHHMDVAKCRKGWTHSCAEACIPGLESDPLLSSQYFYQIRTEGRAWAFISLVQPKKRANTKTEYWYADLSMLILKRKHPEDEWICENSTIQGCARTGSAEVFLDPSYEYYCIPFSFHSRRIADTIRDTPFRVTAYSSTPVTVVATSKDPIHKQLPLTVLHRRLLGIEHKLHYPLAPNGLLICAQGQGVLYFVAINAAHDHFLSLRLTVEPKKGLLFWDGISGDTYDIRPRSQRILIVVSSDGTATAATCGVSFSYASDIVPVNPTKATINMNDSSRVTSAIDITLAGDLLASGIDPGSPRNKGAAIVESDQWTSQLGSAC